MARHPRVHLADVPLHIVQRGHNRQPCFFDAVDYGAYLRTLRMALAETGIALHAYCLMKNHVHLLITPSDVASVPKLVMSLGRRYVQYINRRYARTGTLWDSRYKSCLIETEEYLLMCQRYIELNPVRAGIVADPARYRWSSHPYHAFGGFDPLLTPRVEYLAFGDNAAERQHAYRQMFESVLADEAVEEIRQATRHDRPLGAKIRKNPGVSGESRPRGRPRKSRPSVDPSGADDQLTK